MTYDVLIVDDSALSRRFVKQCLEIAGVRASRFLEASSGRQAAQILRDAPEVRLVVTDLNMPNGDGEELLREIRAHSEWAQVKVIVITSLQSPARRQALEAAGAFAILGKPIAPVQLAPVIATLPREEEQP